MEMTLSAVAIIDVDSTMYAFKQVFDACRAADVTVPNEVEDYFDRAGLNPESLPEITDENTVAEIELSAVDWTDGIKTGLQILVGNIPSAVKKIRVYVQP